MAGGGVMEVAWRKKGLEAGEDMGVGGKLWRGLGKIGGLRGVGEGNDKVKKEIHMEEVKGRGRGEVTEGDSKEVKIKQRLRERNQ